MESLGTLEICFVRNSRLQLLALSADCSDRLSRDLLLEVVVQWNHWELSKSFELRVAALGIVCGLVRSLVKRFTA